ncbi:MAG: prolipoprotein diacylglyceryl transferase [Bacteroidales bacterium]|nr:prolipoprotein diacylglyceryl transferase [Bacteroidales bacterium]
MLSFITWNVSPEIFTAGGFSLRYYSAFFAIGFVLAYFVIKHYYKQENIPQKELDRLTVFVVLGGILGARIGHCIFYEPSYFLTKEHWLEMILPFSFNPFRFTGFQGLASHGGAIGVLLAVFIFKFKSKQAGFLAILDKVVIPTGFVGALIRFGNLMNSEIYGYPTDLPWGFLFVRNGDTLPCHPTQIYEALCYIVVSIVLILLYRKPKFARMHGLMLGVFLIMVFSARFFIEFLKQNQEAFEQGMALNMGQILSIPAVLFGIGLVIYAFRTKKQKSNEI